MNHGNLQADAGADGVRVQSLAILGMTLLHEEYGGEDPVHLAAPIRDDHLQITIQMRDVPLHGLTCNGIALCPGPAPAGAVTMMDLTSDWTEWYPSPFVRVGIVLPQRRLRDFAAEMGRPEFLELRCTPGTRDPVMLGLAQALLPAFENPQACAPLFLDQVGLAMLVHLCQRYGGLRLPSGHKGALSAAQERRATEALAAHLDGDFSLAAIAAECGLSKGYFVKAFTASFGKTPYRWLLEYRVARAQDLLRTNLPIAEVALDCGFADQSHLSRIFSAIVGVPPGIWRRQHRPGATVPDRGLVTDSATPFAG